METMGKEAEARVVRAIEDAIESTNTGVHPDVAIKKQAEDNQFGPQIVQRMVEAYNTSRTLAHLKHASGHDRADDFPLADAKHILGDMYPPDLESPAKKVASSVLHTDYRYGEETNFMRKGAGASPPPLVEEKAPPIPRDPESVAHLNYSRKLGMERKLDGAKSFYRQQHYKLWGEVKAAADHFRNLYSTPFAEVEMKVAGEHGAVGRGVMDLVFEMTNLSEKRADTKEARQLTYNPREEPYNHINEAILVANDLYKAAAVAVDRQNELEAFCKEANFPAPRVISDPEAEPCVLDHELGATSHPFEKNALLPSPQITGMLALTGGMGALGLEEPDAAKSRERADMAVADPIHEAKLKSIQSKAMMSDFQSNDPIISGYDADEVRTAFNQITQLSPSLAIQPGVMRAMLRRMLQQEGVIEPHEATQLTDVEKNLRQLERSTAAPRG